MRQVVVFTIERRELERRAGAVARQRRARVERTAELFIALHDSRCLGDDDQRQQYYRAEPARSGPHRRRSILLADVPITNATGTRLLASGKVTETLNLPTGAGIGLTDFFSRIRPRWRGIRRRSHYLRLAR